MHRVVATSHVDVTVALCMGHGSDSEGVLNDLSFDQGTPDVRAVGKAEERLEVCGCDQFDNVFAELRAGVP